MNNAEADARALGEDLMIRVNSLSGFSKLRARVGLVVFGIGAWIMPSEVTEVFLNQ